jgi:DMSO/TMAO reductase YedYZ heme-binding membrane subunit
MREGEMSLKKRPPVRFWIESVLASASGFLFLLTLAWRDWIEGVFGWDPDHHNGSFEWVLVAALLLCTLAFSVLARTQWRRYRAVAVGAASR